ncbi:MAG: hypothetical protein ACI9G1_001297 [Pirellulaceae bacterium]|jgi:hypothetical protein
MKTFRFRPERVVLWLVLIGATAGGVVYFTGLSGADILASEGKQVKSPPIPASHQTYLAALRKFRNLTYKQQSQDACLRDLSQSLGIEIRLHESILEHLSKDRKITVETTESVSHLNAIHVVMQQLGFYEFGIVFADDHLALVHGQSYDGPSLRSYNLMGRSDFTTAVRRREIESTLKEVRPASWSLANETWIKPGESVFEIDIYQTQDVHNEIHTQLYNQHAVFALDQDVQSLSIFAVIERQKDGKKIDKAAVVKRLRKKYPYQSMAKRLQHEAINRWEDAPKLSAAMIEHIKTADVEFAKRQTAKFSYTTMRSKSLRLLHEEEVEAFIGRPGAGLMRMSPPGPTYLPGTPPRDLPLASNEMIQSADESPVSLPETRTAASNRRVFLPSQQTLQDFHRDGQSLFLTPQSFGHIKNRNEVAGFQGHGFASVPKLHSYTDRPWYRKEKELWGMHRLELVSLLKHEKPAVYVSRSLPRMEELQNARTRPPSNFELAALVQLREGEDVVSRASLNRIEMVGSLRATKQCQQCHAVKSGALLGAFSYELLRDPQLDPEKHRPEDTAKPIF